MKIQKTKLLSLLLLPVLFYLFFPIAQVSAQNSNPRVIAQAKTNIRELPRTGLPLMALGLAAILPVGLVLRNVLKKKETEESANSVWHDRQSGK